MNSIKKEKTAATGAKTTSNRRDGHTMSVLMIITRINMYHFNWNIQDEDEEVAVCCSAEDDEQCMSNLFGQINSRFDFNSVYKKA